MEIGEGCVIGACSLVLHDVPAHTIFYNERIEKEIAEKKAAYQSGQAYRNGSDDVIDVNYVEKDENE